MKHASCLTCSMLQDHEYAFRKGGEEEKDTWLPPASDKLELVREISGSEQLKRCPQCGTYYFYRYTYEYLVYGSEDEESLNRLTDEQAAKYLK